MQIAARHSRGGRKLLAAAGALALALVGSIGANTATAALGDVDKDTGIVDADAIEAGVITNATQLSSAQTAGKDVVSGRAQIVNPLGGGQLTATYDGFQPVDTQLPVYLQWIDTDGAVSPIYKAMTHELQGAAGAGGAGMYAFKLPEWKDAAGKTHRFTTQTSQRYRVFSNAKITNPSTGNELKLLRTAPGYTPYAFGKGSGDGLGDFPGAVGTMQRTGLWFAELPGDYVQHAAPMNDPKGPLANPSTHYDETALKTFSGNVWLESGNERQDISAATSTGDPVPSKGYTVWASTLTAEGIAAYKTQVDTKTEELQAAAAKQLLTEHPEYIAATVYGPIVDGKYTLRFPEDKYNQEFVYMWVEDPQGNPVIGYSTFTQPEFQNPRHNLQWTPTANPAKNNAGLPGKPFERFHNINFALMSQDYVALDITNFNNVDNPASPGDVAKLVATGTLSPLPSKIEWRDPAGKVVKSCDITTTADLKGSETFDVPADAKDGEVYSAVLLSGPQEIAADSFIVAKDSDGDGVPDSQDPDSDGDGETDNPSDQRNSQRVTHGVKVDGGEIRSNGDNKDNGIELVKTGDKGYDLSGVVVTLTAADGTKFVSGSKATWRGTEKYPVVQNFGLLDVPKGEYTVDVSGYDIDANKWIYLNPAGQLQPGGKVTITGNTGNLFVEFLTKKDTDGDNVPDPVDPDNPADGEDKCPNTPAGAQVNADGCSVAPSVTPKPIEGTVGEPIVPVEVVIDNPGKAEVTGCSAAGLPAGLSAELNADGTACVISGTPTEPVDGGKVTVTVEFTPGDADPGTVSGETTVTIEDAVPGDKPDWNDGETTPDKPAVIPNEGGDVEPGTTVEVTDGPGTATIDEDGNITVTPGDDAEPGDEITVEVKDPDGNKIDEITVTIVGEDPKPVTPDAPGFMNPSLDATANDLASCKVPPFVTIAKTEGVTYKVVAGGKELAPNAEGKYVFAYGQTVTVTATAQDGYTLQGMTTWTYTAKQAEVCNTAPDKPDWNDGETTPDKPIVIPNEGGDVEPGTTVEVTDGPGTATIDEDGNITVTPGKDAKPGDKIIVQVKDKDGKVLDTITVKITKGKLAPGKRPNLPKTGVDEGANGVAAVSAVLAAVAAGAVARRRH